MCCEAMMILHRKRDATHPSWVQRRHHTPYKTVEMPHTLENNRGATNPEEQWRCHKPWRTEMPCTLEAPRTAGEGFLLIYSCLAQICFITEFKKPTEGIKMTTYIQKNSHISLFNLLCSSILTKNANRFINPVLIGKKNLMYEIKRKIKYYKIKCNPILAILFYSLCLKEDTKVLN